MNIIQFVLSYWDSILLLLAVVAGVIFALRRGMKKQVFAILKYLVTEAEAEYGSGTGALKKQAVMAWIYEKMPAILKCFLSEDDISALIEKAWAWMVALINENSGVEAFVTKDSVSGSSTSENNDNTYSITPSLSFGWRGGIFFGKEEPGLVNERRHY